MEFIVSLFVLRWGNHIYPPPPARATGPVFFTISVLLFISQCTTSPRFCANPLVLISPTSRNLISIDDVKTLVRNVTGKLCDAFGLQIRDVALSYKQFGGSAEVLFNRAFRMCRLNLTRIHRQIPRQLNSLFRIPFLHRNPNMQAESPILWPEYGAVASVTYRLPSAVHNGDTIKSNVRCLPRARRNQALYILWMCGRRHAVVHTPMVDKPYIVLHFQTFMFPGVSHVKLCVLKVRPNGGQCRSN